jgi:hypothetical protein
MRNRRCLWQPGRRLRKYDLLPALKHCRRSATPRPAVRVPNSERRDVCADTYAESRGMGNSLSHIMSRASIGPRAAIN